MPSLTSRRLLAALFLLLVFVETGPILLFHHMDAVWLLNNAEDFDFLFWPSLNVAYAPSFFFYHVGTISWGFMKLIHAATATLTGSNVVSLDYFQTFGYLVRSVYATMMLAIPVLYWWRRRDPFITALLVVLALALHLAAPNILLIYHLRVGTQLTNKWLVLTTAALFFDTLRLYLQGGVITPRRVFLSALFAGILFLEIPSYVLFFLPFVIISNGAAPGAWAVIRRCAWWSFGGSIGFLAGLLPFYGTDWRSASGAIFSMIRGLSVGFPQIQPGFREEFIDRLFDPHGPYFWVHVALAVLLGIMLLLGAVVFLGRAAAERRVRFAAWTMLLSILLVFLAHVRIWSTRGSYTSVFSLTFYAFYSGLAAVIILREFSRQSLPHTQISRMASIAAHSGLAIMAALLLGTVIQFDFRKYMSRQAAIGEGFRSLNAWVQELPRPLTVALKGLTHAQGTVPGHMAMAGFLYHAGPGGWNGQDARYYPDIEQARFPGIRVAWPQRATELHYNYEGWKLDGTIADGWPEFSDGSAIVPLTTPLPKEKVAALERSVTLVAVTRPASGRSLVRQLNEGGPCGLIWEGPTGFPAARWLVIPLTDPTTRSEVLAMAWPDTWSRGGHTFYFVTAYFGQFILAIPSPETAATASLPAKSRNPTSV